MVITFEGLITPAGVVIAAGLITGFVQLLKAAIPVIDDRVSGATLAFVVSAALYAVTGSVVGGSDPNAWLLVGASWLSAATSAVGLKSTFDHATTVRENRVVANDLIEE